MSLQPQEKKSTGLVKVGECIIMMKKVPAKENNQLLAFRCMLASIEESGNLWVLIFIQFPGEKKQILKTEGWMQGHNIVFGTGETINSP